MSITNFTAYVVACDRCGTVATLEARVAQWRDPERAVSDLCGPVMGWLATAVTQICPQCLARAVCASRGHEWSGWGEIPELLEPPPGARLWIRMCGRCGADEVTEAEALGWLA